MGAIVVLAQFCSCSHTEHNYVDGQQCYLLSTAIADQELLLRDLECRHHEATLHSLNRPDYKDRFGPLRGH